VRFCPLPSGGSPDRLRSIFDWSLPAAWRKPSFISVDDQSGIGTGNGVNGKGELVGFYGTSAVNSGFVATLKQ
jgi:hypothetical protein